MLRFVCLVLSVCAFCAVWAPPARADAVDDGVAQQRINLAGRQRMLTQRMTAAACLAMAGADRAARIEIAKNAHDEFQQALTGLVDGDTALGLSMETDANVRAALLNVTPVWAQLSPAVQQILAGDVHSVVVSQMLSQNVPALRASNAAVQAAVAAYGTDALEPGLARAIDLAGRQRMLSQKMMKEACFLSVGLKPDEALANLRASMDTFERTLMELQHGNNSEGIVAPPTESVAHALRAERAHWEKYHADLVLLLSQVPDDVDRPALTDLARQSDALLAAAHQAVLRYVEAASATP